MRRVEVVVRALRSFELVVGTLGVTALLGGVAWPLPASAQRLEFGEEGELELLPPDLSFVPPSRRPAPRYDLEQHLDRLSSPAPLAGGAARLLFTTRRGTRIYSESSLALGLSAGLAPMPGTIDPRVSTQRYQLRADTPRGWSIVAEAAVMDPRTARSERLQRYFVGVMAPPRPRVRMGFGYWWGGGGPRFFGLVLRW
jgi:hypothetical protein